MATRAEHNRKQYLKNREARLAAQKAYCEANREARIAYNKEYAEKNKEIIAAQRKAYREANCERRKQSLREWYLKNAEYAKQQAKQYRIANKDKVREWHKIYRKERMAVDPVYALTIKIRALVNIKLISGGYTKRSQTHKILGCSYPDFKLHIERQFFDGMSWDNHGEWHLDHIVPIATATCEDDVIRLNHYTNFQPLWAIDNLRKGSSYVSV